VAKPIDPAALFATVARHSGRPESGVTSPAPPPRPDPADREAALQEIEGLDTRDGLSRVAGNRKLYERLLGQFVEQQGPAVGLVLEALDRGDRALAERLAHTLRGVAGNIGAKGVQETAGALEKRIRERSSEAETREAATRVSGVLDPLVARLRDRMVPPPPAPAEPVAPEPVDPGVTGVAAEELAKLLADFDPGAVEFIEANSAALRPLFAGAAWPEFRGLVADYAFPAAEARLAEARKGFRVP
jgi:two-component system sensor histidine kinase/response regulator